MSDEWTPIFDKEPKELVTADRIKDYDFQECMKYLKGVQLSEVAEMRACVPGEADGPDWHYVIKINDGRFAVVEGGCDYTGWGCQEGGNGSIHATAEEAAKAAEDDYDRKDISKQLLAQIAGKQPYGTYIS